MSKFLIDTDELSIKATENCPLETAKAIVMLESGLIKEHDMAWKDIEFLKALAGLELIMH